MNHYPHHIGDFNSATRHLTFVERALYRELLDLYYDTERPLNGDVKKLARRVLANTEELLQALEQVLEEFFCLREDGWHNARCDREIAAYKEKQEQQSRAGKASAAKRAGEKKPRKSAAADQHDATPVQRPFNDPLTNQNQNQNQNHIKETSSPKGGGDVDVLSDPELVPSSEPVWAELFGQEFGVEVSGYSQHDRKKFWPLAKGWVTAGVTVGQMRAAVQRARAEATEGIAYLPAYVDRVLASMSAPQESRAEAAARARMQEAAPLAAARQPGPVVPSPQAAPALDGYAFFAAQSKTFPALEVHDAVS